MFDRYSINGSVVWLGVPDFHRNYENNCTANILAPCPSWGYRGYITNPNWGCKSEEASGNVSVP